MGFSPNGRATFLTLMANRGGEGEPDEVIAFLRDHWEESLDEIGAVPGWDQVRAGLIRVLPPLLDAPAREALLDRAQAALEAFPHDAAEGDPAVLLARHPAWVGLAILELAEVRQGAVQSSHLRQAVELAGPGFRATGANRDVERGEILWAMAEAAEEMGWIPRARQLLRVACQGPFAQPEHGHQVRLLLGLSLVEAGEPEGVELLEALAEETEAPEQARIHAWWVISAVARQKSQPEVAADALERALELALAAEEEGSEVIERIRAAKAELAG